MPPRGAGERNELLGAFLGERLAGFAFFGLFSQPSFAFLIYIAVEPDLRGGGIGAKLFAEVVRRAETLATQSGEALEALLLEVEREEDAPDEAARIERTARLHFFERRGARILSRFYTQPSLRPDSSPVPLNLLWLPLSGSPDPRSLVPSLHESAFGLDAGHPFVVRTLAAIEDGGSASS